jgi:hypothetical protein
MSTTAQQIYKKALALIDELLPTGAINAAKTGDYAGKAPSIIDMLQKELTKNSDLYKIYEIACSPIPNMLGLTSGFDIQEYKGLPLTFECSNDTYGGVKAYHFEVDKPCTVYIEDYNGTWNTLSTITASPTVAGFTPYKGTVTPTVGATKSRIRATGTYYFRIVNRGLFNYPVEQAPDYMPWIKIDLPTDLKSIDQVITEFPDRQYTKDANYKTEWEGNRQSLYVNYYYIGKIRVQYKPIPTEITALTDTLEIDDITAQIIAYGLAESFVATEQNEYLAKIFKDKFNILKAENYVKQPVTIQNITDVYSSMGW